MKAIVNTGIGKLELLEIPLPEPCEGQVRIRTAATGICATDLTMIDGCTRSKYPQIPGHEWSGFIDKAGVGVSKEIEGKLCVAENVISDGGEVGFEHPGAYGEYFVTEAANVRILPKSFPVSEAALIEPLAVCVRGIRRLRITDRKSALIFGDGPVGQIMLMLLRLNGVNNIVLVGGRKGRLETAAKNGASAIVNYHEVKCDLAEEIAKGKVAEFANVIEAAGTGKAVSAAFALAAKGGHILMIGDYDKLMADFSWQSFLHRELEIISSNASSEAWDDAVALVMEKKISLSPLVSKVFPVSKFQEAMALVRSRSPYGIKVVLEW